MLIVSCFDCCICFVLLMINVKYVVLCMLMVVVLIAFMLSVIQNDAYRYTKCHFDECFIY
jgi:hypothetical protein